MFYFWSWLFYEACIFIMKLKRLFIFRQNLMTKPIQLRTHTAFLHIVKKIECLCYWKKTILKRKMPFFHSFSSQCNFTQESEISMSTTRNMFCWINKIWLFVSNNFNQQNFRLNMGQWKFCLNYPKKYCRFFCNSNKKKLHYQQ